MKKKFRRMGCMALMASVLLTGVGCTQKNETEESQEGISYIYDGIYEDITVDENSYIGQIKCNGEYVYYFVGSYEGENQELHYKNIEDGTEQSIPITLSSTQAYAESVAIGAENEIYYLETVYHYEDANEELNVEYYIVECDKSGKEIARHDITELAGKNKYFYIQSIGVVGENLYICSSDNIILLDKETFEKKNSINSAWISGMCTSSEEIYYLIDGDNGMEIVKLDGKTGEKLDSYTNLPYSSSNDCMVIGKDERVYYNTASSLYVLNEDTRNMEEVVNWLDSDIDGETIQAYTALSEDKIYIVVYNWQEENSDYEEVLLEKKEMSPENERIELTYATTYLDSSLRSVILKFNRTNGIYRIKTKIYEDQQDTVFLADLTGNNPPDLVDISSLNYRSLLAKELFADLKPLIEEDSDLKLEDYVENVMQSGELDGKLYFVRPTFSITTLVAKKSNIEGAQLEDLTGFIKFIKNRPAGSKVFEYATKEDLLSVLLSYNINSFIDWETGTCKFDSEDFLNILELCNEMPLNYEEDPDGNDLVEDLRNNKVLFQSLYINKYQEIQVYKKMLEDDISFVGYPSNNEMVPMISSPNMAIAITNSCKDTEGAFAFIKELLSDEVQESDRWYELPVKKSALEKEFEKDQKAEYETLEDGTKQEVSKGGYGFVNWQCEIYAATEDEINILRELIDQAKVSAVYDNELFSMINEEAQAYFNGQKSAGEVAKIIQSRLSLYVSEQM